MSRAHRTPAAPPRLELRGITKRFPGVIANSDVSFSVAPGEVHALLGENGAGKSTLVKIIYGVLHADEGEILWDGRPVQVADPHAARALGVGMVFQHFSLFEAMTVLENVALGVDGVTDMKALAARVREVSHAYGLPLEPEREVHTLSVGERQRIEIVRCLLQNPRSLIMDEPTSVLTPQEVDRLFETLRQLASEGVLDPLHQPQAGRDQALCDRATILRGGKVVGTCDPKVETAREHGAADDRRRAAHADDARRAALGQVRLGGRASRLPSEEAHGVDLKRVGFEVRAGEIMGIAGVAGNGQNELMLALQRRAHVRPETAIRIDGKPVGQARRRRSAERSACAACPRSATATRAVPEMSLADNARAQRLPPHGLPRRRLHPRRQGAATTRRGSSSEFDVRTPGVDTLARSLSGGNLQKFVVGREVLQDPGVLVVVAADLGRRRRGRRCDPSGADRPGRPAPRCSWSRRTSTSSSMLTDRLAVIDGGRLSRADADCERSVEEIGLLMGGAHGTTAPHRRGGLGPCRLDSSRAGTIARHDALLTPPLAVVLTVVTGFILFTLLGIDPSSR